jgi:hypothetical protein
MWSAVHQTAIGATISKMSSRGMKAGCPSSSSPNTNGTPNNTTFRNLLEEEWVFMEAGFRPGLTPSGVTMPE